MARVIFKARFAVLHKGPLWNVITKAGNRLKRTLAALSAAASVPWLSRRRRSGPSYIDPGYELNDLHVGVHSAELDLFEGCIGQLLLVLFSRAI